MTTIAPAIRLLAALRSGATLVARPRGVVHVYAGPLTRSGRAVPGAARPFCGTRSRRLRVIGRADDLGTFPGSGRRFCRSCTGRLPAALGRTRLGQQMVARDDWLAAYDGLTVGDLALAAAWCRTVDETHQVGTLLLMLHGPSPINPDTDGRRELRMAHDLVLSRRKVLSAAALTPEEREAKAARREAQDADRRLAAAGRRRSEQIARASDRRLRGKYLMPHERELLSSG